MTRYFDYAPMDDCPACGHPLVWHNYKEPEIIINEFDTAQTRPNPRAGEVHCGAGLCWCQGKDRRRVR